MLAPTFTTVSLLKFYSKWPSPTLRNWSSNSLLSVRYLDVETRVFLPNNRSQFLGGVFKPRLGDFWNGRNPARDGCDIHYAAVAKGLRIESEEGAVVPDQSRGGLPRFHVSSLPIAKGMTVRVDGDEFWHMTRVLRLNVNDRIELFDGSGGLVEGTLLKVTKNCAEVLATTERRLLPLTGPNWHVAAAFGNLKGGRADWLVEKCTELGAQTLTPLLTHRSASVAEQRSDRWNRISMAATKQCQRLHALDVREPTHLKHLLAEVKQAEVAFLAAAGAPPLAQSLLQRPERLRGGLLLIGPEGDFTPEEIELLIDAGAVPVGLGQLRLRVETAAIASLTTVVLLSEGYREDLKSE